MLFLFLSIRCSSILLLFSHCLHAVTLPICADADSFPPAVRRQGRILLYCGIGSDGSSLVSKHKVVERSDSLQVHLGLPLGRTAAWGMHAGSCGGATTG